MKGLTIQIIPHKLIGKGTSSFSVNVFLVHVYIDEPVSGTKAINNVGL